MKYLIPIFTLLILFTGCSEKKSIPKKTIHIQKIEVKDLTFTIKEHHFSYDFNQSKILVFLDASKASTFQIDALNDLNKTYYVINKPELIKYFNINRYPTIIITKDINHTKRYEGFIPSQMLKYELNSTQEGN